MVILFVILGLAPSIIWLGYYLRKDVHPEPNSMVLGVFLWGILIAPLAAGAEIMFAYLGKDWGILEFPNVIVWNFIGIAFIEEYAKYYVVKRKVLKNKSFDEPVDAMIYLVIAALGFAALENILILLNPLISNYLSMILPEIKPVIGFEISDAVQLITMRFWGATLLHTLSSAVLGFFLALSFYHKGRFKYEIFPIGLILATLLHGLFNYFILQIEAAAPSSSMIWTYLLLLIVLLGSSAVMVDKLFRILRSRWALSEIQLPK